MTSKWLIRGAVGCALGLALWLGWRQVRPPERVGDVPYVQTPPEVVDRMLDLAGVGPDDVLYDLGSGDGRIVIRAAQRFGARGRGFEIDPLLVLESRSNAAIAGVADRARFVEGDLFEADLREATVVTLYLLPTVNLALRPRLIAQLAPGTPVVSHAFDMAEWQPDGREIIELDRTFRLYRWVVPAGVGGTWTIEPVGPRAQMGTLGSAATIGLRLGQRFQEVEGELVVDRRSVPLDGRVTGTAVTLETSRQVPGGARWRFDGTLLGGRIEGSMRRLDPDGADLPPFAFAAERNEVDLAGIWDVGGTIEPPAPEWSLRLQPGPEGWTATRVDPDTSERPLVDLYVWGGGISFFLGSAEAEGRRIGYHGLVDGDRIAGSFNDGGGLAAWTARRRRSP